MAIWDSGDVVRVGGKAWVWGYMHAFGDGRFGHMRDVTSRVLGGVIHDCDG